MTYKKRKSSDINKDIYLVKDPKTGLNREATYEESSAYRQTLKTKELEKVGGKKKKRKNKTKKKKRGGGNLVQATEDEKIGKNSKARSFDIRKIDEPLLLTTKKEQAQAQQAQAPAVVQAKPSGGKKTRRKTKFKKRKTKSRAFYL